MVEMNADTNLALIRNAQAQKSTAAQTAQSAQKLPPSTLKRIDESAKEFEAVFLTEMLKPMFKEMQPDPLFGGGKTEEVFQGIMLQEYGKIMAEKGGVGIAEHVKAELIRIQEETRK